MAPKNLAIAGPERAALRIAIPFRLYANLFRPFINVLNAVAIAGLRAMGVEPKDELLSAHSAQEIGYMISESAKGGLLKPVEHRLLSGAVNFRQRDAASVMVPRTELVAIPITVTPADIESITLSSGHSRLPVYERDLDHIVGMVHIKDLLRVLLGNESIQRTHARPLPLVPETAALDSVLATMRRERTQMVIVLDEHGGTAGVVTLEDLFEEVVGEIEEGPASPPQVYHDAEGRLRVPGTMRLDELGQQFDLDLEHEDVDSVSGLVLTLLGRTPEVADTVHYERLRLEVTAVKGHGVDECAVSLEDDAAPRAERRTEP
jgi:CBS domain containing-hemolysin-like protein